MSGHLQKVGNIWRIASIAACLLSAIVALMVSSLLWIGMVRRASFNYEGKPLWFGAVFLSFLGLGLCYLTWRLWVGTVSENGYTILPSWFIQVFGLVFLAGLLVIVFAKHNPELLFEGIPIALAMILVGSHTSKRKRRRDQFIQRMTTLSATDREKVLSQFSDKNRQKLEQILKDHANKQKTST